MKNCPKCGAELNDDDRFCNSCGEAYPETEPIVEATPPVEETTSEKPKKKVKWWMIVIPVVLAVVVLTVCFWNRIVFAVAPQAVLAKAVTTTGAELASRSEGNPLELMASAVDATGKSTAVLNFEAFDEETDTNIGMDWTLRSDALAKQQNADICLSMYGISADLSYYIDADCLTVGASILNNGQPYGITFDTIREDVEKCELFVDMTQEDKDAFVEGIETLADAMSSAWSEDEMEAISGKYLAIFQETLSKVQMEKRWEKLDVHGVTKNCAVVSYTLTQTEIADLLESLLNELEQEEWVRAQLETYEELYEEIGEENPYDTWFADMRETIATIRNDSQITDTFSFYLCDGKLLNVGIDEKSVTADEEVTLDLDVLLGENPATEDIVVTCLYADTVDTLNVTLTAATRKEEGLRGDSLTILASDQNGELLHGTASYLWNTVTGNMDLTLTSESEGETPVNIAYTINLAPVEGGFQLDFGDLMTLVRQFVDEETYDISGVGLEFSMSVVKGCQITKPAYINLDQWTMDDLYSIFGGLTGGF